MMTDQHSAPCPLTRDSDVDVRYLAGLLSAEEAGAFEAHYFACDRCFAAVQRGTELRAALSADAAGVLSTTSQHMHQGARRVRFIARWRPALAAAALLVITVGLWRMDSLRSRFADDRSTAASDFRGAQGSFVVASHATSRMLMAAWTARARARSYRVRLLTGDGTLILERETSDTGIILTIDSLPGVLRKAPLYWEVQALDALRAVVGTTPPTLAALRQAPP